MQKLTAKKIGIGRAIEGLRFAPDRITATDSFRLLEVKKDTGVAEPIVLSVPGFAGRENVDVKGTIVTDGKKSLVATRLEDQNYPIYESIFPTTEPTIELTFNPQLLGELLMEISKHTKPLDGVKLKFYGKLKPMVVEGKDVRAMCMPMNK